MIYTTGDFDCLKNTFFCMYKMYVISVEGYENASVKILTIKKLVKFWWVWKMCILV